MATSLQQITRGAIRRSIGKNLGIVIDGAATSTVDTSSLLDTKNLIGADDDYNGREVLVHTPTGSIVAGESSVVSDFAGSTNDATCAPVFSASITSGDLYEMWKTPWRIADINDAINQAINDITRKALQVKEIHTPFTESAKYLYDILSGFTHVSKVEYVSDRGTYHALDTCEDAWTAGVGTTTTADTAFKKVGTASSKNVTVTVGATTVLCYKAITSVDISDCDKVEFWMYSSITVTAGQLQIKLDDTAAIVSALEAIDIPAMTAGTWYKHSLSLANPHLDTAIISIGVYQVANLADFTFYVDEVEAVNTTSPIYQELPLEYWNIAKGSTPYLQLTSDGLSTTGTNTQLRVTGYQIAARMDADATVSEIDPGWLIPRVTGRLLMGHAKSSFIDIDDRKELAKYWLGEAATKEVSLIPNMPGGTRSVS